MDDPLKKQLRRGEHGNVVSPFNRSTRRSVRFIVGDWRRGSDDDPPRPNRFVAFLRRQSAGVHEILTEWLYLAALGIIVAIISAVIDQITNVAGIFLHGIVFSKNGWSSDYFFVSFGIWVAWIVVCVMGSAAFVRVVAPQAIGSGIPEMKTIIRGVILKDYLTIRTLISKIGGLILILMSGLPTGKGGPMVHISSIVANELSILAARLEPTFSTEAKRMEALAAACAVGIASTFSAPVGGVLFSIETTTTYFSINNYWKGFFASSCGAIVFRLLRGILIDSQATVKSYYQTHFASDSFVANELFFFAFLGVFCGLLGALYIKTYKAIVLFLRNNAVAKRLFQKHWFVYPLLIALLFALTSHPQGIGEYFAGRIRFGYNLRDFFSNCSFKYDAARCPYGIGTRWYRGHSDVLLLLVYFVTTLFFSTLLCQTLPVPSGLFGPTFVIGAAIGRIQGELLLWLFREGLVGGFNIQPGVYAVVGAAAFSSSVAHSISVTVVIFEMTGQMNLILPVLIATLIAKGVSAYFTPSWFDTCIEMKHLPFLPDIPPTGEKVHSTTAEDIMVTPVLSLTRNTTYEEVRKVLLEGMELSLFPVLLLGTVSRRYLLEVLEAQVGDEARRCEAESRVRRAVETIDLHFRQAQEQNTRLRRSNSDIRPSRQRVRGAKSVEAMDRQGRSGERRASASSNRFQVCSAFLPPHLRPGNVDPGIGAEAETPPPPPVSRGSFRAQKGERRRPGLFTVTEILEEEPETPAEPRRPSFVAEAGANGDSDSDSSSDERCHLTVSAATDTQNVIKTYKQHAKRFVKAMKKAAIGQKEALLHDLNPKEVDPLPSSPSTTGLQRAEWEREQLHAFFIIPDSSIDPSPFHLVLKTSLHKIHSIFTMMQLSRSYVLDCGRLVGVIALGDVRRALQSAVTDTPVERKPSVTGPWTGVVRTATMRMVAEERIYDVLTPTLEVVKDNEATVERDAALVRRENQANTTRSAISRSLSPIIHRPKKSPGGSAENLVEAVSYLRDRTLSPPSRASQV